tara:strand:- start:3086 stop:3277 length:192 start_codon:yes stop_codon:yes gene_type:complete
MAEKGQTLFAILSFHISGTAFSEKADYPNALYLILSLNAHGVFDLRRFYLRDKKLMRLNYQYE